MLTVITPAANKRLTTPAAVRDAFGYTTGTHPDSKLEPLIDQASAAIHRHVKRTFALERVREDLQLGRTEVVILARSPIVTLHSATEYDGVTLTSSDYLLDSATGLLTRYREPRGIWWSCGPAQIEYTAGYLLPGEEDRNLPHDVERAALLVVNAYLTGMTRDPLLRSESVEGVGSQSFTVMGADHALPSPEALSLLKDYRPGAWSVG